MASSSSAVATTLSSRSLAATNSLSGSTTARLRTRIPRGAPLVTRAGKGKGKRYRNEVKDPYAAKETRAKPSADDGPLNVVFAPGDDTEEYFLFVRKVRKGSAAASPAASPASTAAAAAAVDVGLSMRGPNAPGPGTGGADETNERWLPLGDIVISAGGDLDLAVAERRAVLLAFAKRKHLKMLPIASDEEVQFGARTQRGPKRAGATDPSETFPVATGAAHAALEWDEETRGEFGAPSARAELRLMSALPTISTQKKNEMLAGSMSMIKAQQEKMNAEMQRSKKA